MREGKKYVILGSLCALLVTMTVAYAAFQSSLQLKGTSNITSKWDILITNVEEINKGGGAITTEKEGKQNPSWDGLTANIEADLTQKGDFIEYEITVENRGTLDAKLNEIKTNTIKEHEAILMSFEGYTKGEKLSKGTSQKIIVRIEYNPNFEGIPEIGSKEINIELEYNQNDDYNKEENGEITSPDRYLVTYDCTTNGGEKCTSYNEYLKEGENVNLINQGTNKKYDFIGWNTDPKAREGITDLTMQTEEITLYAIYQGDPIIQSWTSSDTTDFHSASYKQSIISAEFLDNKNIPENATESWDVSAAKDKSVMAWVVPDTQDSTKHHLYIGGKGRVIANEDSSYLFYQFTNMQSIEFHNNFDTSNVTNMYDMFAGSGIITIDISSFDTSKVINLKNLFCDCDKLKNIKGLEHFDTSNVTNMMGMFARCYLLTDKLNLCSFDTRKVTNTAAMFLDDSKLTKIYVGSNWVINSGADTNSMFGGAGTSSVTQSNNCEVEAEDPATIELATSTTTNSITVVVDATADSGIAKYDYQIDNGQWIESTENIYTFIDLEQNQEYIIKVKVTSNVGKVTTIETTDISLNYTNSEQIFNIPFSGLYKLEVWGASGGYAYDSNRTTGDGGYGAYAVGTIELKANQNLHVVIGGEGQSNCQTTNCAGGYNGGSNSNKWASGDGSGLYTGGGGGATHIAGISGVLSELENAKDKIYIVAAGGGGGDYFPSWSKSATGGSGGGIAGVNSKESHTDIVNANTRGTQTSGYAFGKAGTLHTTDSVGGSGGGWYGGISPKINHSTGAGGSSYIGNSLLIDKVMYCYNCEESSAESTRTISTTNVSETPISNYAKKGNGAAKITFINVVATTKSIETPTFEEKESEANKEVTITYPEGCGDKLTCSYQKDEEDWIEVNTQIKDVIFSESGVVVTKVTDGTNEVTASHTVVFEGNNLEYNGEVQTFTADKDGYYKIELWGAQGGSTSIANGGNGSYTSGEIYLHQGDALYIHIGQQPTDVTSTVYNGGGISKSDGRYQSGGGATDVRTTKGAWNDATSLNSRIMVAAGGGGAYLTNTSNDYLNGAAGGDLIGNLGKIGICSGTNTTYCVTTVSKGGTQTSGGSGGTGQHTNGNAGSFGFGGNGNGCCTAGGGSGYYGGGSSGVSNNQAGSGAGGSSYISGYAGVNSITSESDRTHTNQTKHYSDKYFINTEMQAGVNSGDGKAKITYLKAPSSKDSTKIKGVRYIKDCTNGSSVNTSNHWVELQAISKGINVAKGKDITSTTPPSNSNYVLSTIVDGKMDDTGQYTGFETGIQCITVDLGQEYDLEEIAVWHYYGDGRTYNNNSTSVAGENEVYRMVYNGSHVETSNGNRIRKDSIS